MKRAAGVRGVVVAALLVGSGLIGSGVAVAASVPSVTISNPTGPQTEIEADRPVQVPDTKSCTETIANHTFGNSYGAPYTGTFTPVTDCGTSWNKVVMTLTSTVATTQFDRDVYVAVGGSVLLDGTTSEPCCTGNSVSWTVQRDVTKDSAIFHQSQPVMVELDNVNDSTYTGQYDTVVTLTFYSTGKDAPAAAVPSVVIPISSSSPSSPMYTIGAVGQKVGSAVTFPTNLSTLNAEVFADAHGPCEEFWWSDPENCAGVPYREVAIYIDGQLAGAAPAYPVTYTGADGPGLWEPIPSPRAWNMRPYDLDLTPFVGELTDGQPHTVQLGVLDTGYTSGDFWALSANLFGTTQSSTPTTTGGLTSVTGPKSPTNTTTEADAAGATAIVSSKHTVSFTGWINTPAGRRSTTVKDVMSGSSRETVGTDHGIWDWTQTESQSTKQNGVPTKPNTILTATAHYAANDTELTSFSFQDNGSTESQVGKTITAATAYDETMTTADATGLEFNGVEYEKYGYADSTGACYDHTLSSQAEQITVNTLDSFCPKVA